MDEERMHLRRMALRSFLRERPAARQGVALSVFRYLGPCGSAALSCVFVSVPCLQTGDYTSFDQFCNLPKRGVINPAAYSSLKVRETKSKTPHGSSLLP